MRKLVPLALLAFLAVTPLRLSAEPLRLSTEAFGRRAIVEVRDLPAGENEVAARAALEEVLRLARLVDPLEPPDSAEEHAAADPPASPPDDPAREAGSSKPAAPATHLEIEDLATLNNRGGSGPQPVDPLLLEVLAKARDFCLWSRGANGPLAGRLRELWGFYHPVEGPPTPAQIHAAVADAACKHLHLDRQASTAWIDGAGRLDLSDFATGWAVDRAVEVLREHGATNGFVEVGLIRRGFGPGPDGRGWEVVLPVFAGSRQALGEIWLRDRSLAIAHFEDRRAEVEGDRRYSAYFDLRKGEPVQGVIAVIAVSELAVDAQGLATTLFATGNREGQFLLSRLRPVPSVRWLLGSGEGKPLITDYNWGETRTR